MSSSYRTQRTAKTRPQSNRKITIGLMSRHKYSRYFCWPFYLLVVLFVPLHCQGFCPSKCVCDDESLEVHCTNASLDLIPFLLNPHTRTLSLPCNKIETIGQSLAFYPDLRNIDLSYNQIKSIEADDFSAQRSLEILNLNKNRLKLIRNVTLVPLIGLKELYLSNNILSSLEPNSFDMLRELKVLDLSNNKLRSFAVNTFSNKNGIEVLKLNYNYFSYVPYDALSNIKSLTQLELTGNLLSEVPRSAFQALKNLSSLILDKNNISVIYRESFAGLSHLTTLSIKDNRLPLVYGNYFRSLGNLRNLDLSGNLFREVKKNSFPRLPFLRHLRLTRCPRLYRIESESFDNVEGLETLQLSHNARLVYLGDSTFSPLNKLKDLDLTACGLVYVHRSQMPQSTSTTLHLAGNPLHCNCSIMWLAALPVNDSFYFDAPTCATPPTLYGVPVHKVELRAAGCDHPLGLAAIGTCVGVILLGLLVIAVFLAWKWRKRTLATTKTLPGTDSSIGIRDPSWIGNPASTGAPINFQGTPIYVPKYYLPSHGPVSSCGHTQCQGLCHIPPQPPYSLHPVTRPLLTPPSPSLNNHSHLPVEWLYPSPYDDDTHWYTTIGRDGREYLTGELKRDYSTPPPLPQETPPPLPPLPNEISPTHQPLRQETPSKHSPLPPSSPSSVRIKRDNSFASTGQRTPIIAKRPRKPSFRGQGLSPSPDEKPHIPVTYEKPHIPVTYI